MGCKTNSFSDECDDNHCNKSVPALFGVSGAGGVTFNTRNIHRQQFVLMEDITFQTR